MTTQEFSDAFSTLLNSYNTQAHFGEQASKREIVLDEYEKSVFLTQAQDIVVKTYFDRTLNNQAQGFDDSARRQIDFSSLITVDSIEPYTGNDAKTFDHRGVIYKLPTIESALSHQETNRVLYILNETLVSNSENSIVREHTFTVGKGQDPIKITATLSPSAKYSVNITVQQGPSLSVTQSGTTATTAVVTFNIPSSASAQDIQGAISLTGTLAEHLTFTVSGTSNNISDGYRESITLNDSSSTDYRRNAKRYTIVPISYVEYDREMSKPYAQPLKKQAWRLVQNNNVNDYDIYSELITNWAVDPTTLIYKIRYVRRPYPIILVSLPDNLEIDGEKEVHECELNPILHMDILNKAVELAVATHTGGLVSTGSSNLQKQQQSGVRPQ